MSQRRFLSFAAAGILGVATGVPIQGLADDTEIYTGGSAIEGVRPNILLILDTSGSMAAVDNSGQTRMTTMKNSVTNLLDSLDNVNVGMMNFTDPGGPILFPVSPIDADADTIGPSGQSDVVVQVSADEDDAEQLVTAPALSPNLNDVMLDSLYLELLSNPAFGTESRYLRKVRENRQDAEQSTQAGSLYSSSATTLRLGPDRPGNAPFTIGMIFEDLADDTENATVLFARLNLVPAADGAGDVDAKVFGLFSRDSAFNFSASRNGPGVCPVDLGHPNQVPDQDIYCLLGLELGAEYNAGIDYANVAGYSHTAGTGLVTDSIITWDNVPDAIVDEPIQTPNLAPVLKEIFDHPNWKSISANDDLALFLTTTSASAQRLLHSDDAGNGRQPELLVDYVPAGAPAGRQLVALRFRNVLVPQLARIESAALVLTPTEDSADPLNIRISAERVGSATRFTEYKNGAPVGASPTDRLSTRLATRRTAQTATWPLTAGDVWTQDVAMQSVDFKNVIQEVVAQGDWCGGNDLVIFLEYDTPPGAPPPTRRVYAHDADPNRAATLKINYDKADFSPGEGCTTKTVFRRVVGNRDDARELPSLGFVELNGATLQTPTFSGLETISGAVFRTMPIPAGATVTGARLVLASALDETANSSTLRVKGQLTTGVIDEFSATAFNISSRTAGARGTAHVDVTVPPVTVTARTPFETGDISPVIQAIIDQADWSEGDDMLLTFGAGSGQLDIVAADGDPSQAPALRVTIRYNVGDLIANLPEGAPAGVTTVRQRLKELLTRFRPDGFTPLVDTHYEAARYYRGEGVVWGASRGGVATKALFTRLSHPASYTGGTVFYPPGCNTDDSNLDDPQCRNQTITGSPTYVSPITESCQQNFIIMLTDGQANNNNSAQKIRGMTGNADCQLEFSDTEAVNDGEECGVDLSRFLFENDQSATVPGVNNVVTYTVGFALAEGISTRFLRDTAEASDGRFFTAGNEDQLTRVFQAILTDVLSRATSFAAPSLSVNAFNRLEDRNDVYFSLFTPSTTVAWNGNIKKFQLCQSEQDACVTTSGAEVGDILDARSPPAVAIGPDGRILDEALSFWSGSADGPKVLKGGAGGQLTSLGHASRRVFTLTRDKVQSGTPPAATVSFFPSPVDLGALNNRIIDADGDGVLDGLIGSAAEKLAQTRELLGMGTQTTAELSDQISWIRGKDVDGLFDDLEFGDNRWAIGDPLHGNPLAITFGGTAENPIVKLLSGTNDGGIRLINTSSGKEEWIFFPSEMLPMQQELRDNGSSPQRLYGVDGTATPWIRDTGQIGIIDPSDGDFVRVFIGARRGGNFYYGLDITPSARIPDGDTEVLTHISPKIMWRIRGGTPEFPMLGQSWSRPVLVSMLLGTDVAGRAERRPVLIFAGGYESATQDASAFGKSSAVSGVGNAIYVVDAETGERLFFVGGPDAVARHSGSAPVRGVEVADMEFPIPSDVTAFDSNGDGAVDRIYVGDTGGQLWRIDVQPNRAGGVGQEGITGVVGKLATVSFSSTDSDNLADAPADERKFFYPPSVIQVRGAGSLSNADYDLVSAVTGNRANPLNLNVRDRFYAFRDYAINPFLDADGDGLADGYTTIQGDLDGDPDADPAIGPRTFNEMLDFTILDGPEDLPDPSAFVTSAGYFLRLDTGGPGSGEKGLAAPTTLAGKVFFTTYLPEGVVDTDACSLAEGRGQLYGIDAITGSAIFNWDTPGDPTVNRADRTYALGSGIPSNPVPVFFPEKVMLLIGVGGGAETVDPAITVPQRRTYWFQQ